MEQMGELVRREGKRTCENDEVGFAEGFLPFVNELYVVARVLQLAAAEQTARHAAEPTRHAQFLSQLHEMIVWNEMSLSLRLIYCTVLVM